MSAMFSTVVLADGNETLGPPSISIASGSGIVAAGTGMTVQPATLELEVPGTAVAQALLYWNGEGAFAGDDTIDVEIGGQNHVIVGDLIGGPEFFFAFGGNSFYSSAYRADVTDLIHTGSNTLTISGLDFVVGDAGNGAGLLVIFDDGTTSGIEIRDGQDIAFARFPATRDAVVPQTFAYAASVADQVATVQMFLASVGEERPNLIRITVDGGGVTELINSLGSHDGEHWDTLRVDVDIPAGSTSLTIEAVSFEDGSNVLPASLTWIAAGVARQVTQDCCEFGKPRILTMRYTGGNCDVTSHSQDDGKVTCEGDPAGLATVHIIASDKEDLNDSRAKIWFDGLVDLGDTFELDARSGGSGDLKAKTFLHIFDPNGGLLQIVEFHTSCSQPLVDGDRFGSATLVGCVGKDTPVEGDCCVDGKPRILTLEYTGENCDVTSHSQDPTKVACEGDPAGLATVHIIASDKENLDDSRAKFWFDGLVNLGDTFDLDAANGGAAELKAKTFLHIFDTDGVLLQFVEFHTSCSQPLVEGDRFGSVTLVGCVGRDVPVEDDCGDGSCGAGEDQCNCAADCGSPPASETNCSDANDDDCDGDTDCADADCSGDPACSGAMTGEGYILSKNADFSTDDRTFNQSDTLYMLVWSDQVDFNDIKHAEWELKDADKHKVKQSLTNNADITYTAAYDLSNLPSSLTAWQWKGKIEDNAKNKFQPTDNITVLP
ncbi:MAG: hypothetical protein IH987_21680 [Planctomycetes bacterium]|nr:hypothetical protein [Planctomycetota bacterium]